MSCRIHPTESRTTLSRSTLRLADAAELPNDEELAGTLDGSRHARSTRAAQRFPGAHRGHFSSRDSDGRQASPSRTCGAHGTSTLLLDDASSVHRRKPLSSCRQRPAPQAAKALVLLSLPGVAFAAPSNLSKRDGGGAVKIIAPVVVVVAVLIIGLIIMMVRKGWHRNMAHWGANAAANFGPNPGVTEEDSRELTAQQLAGPDAPALPRSRRTRRNRRTPSQISTRSLPVYMKEPGEHEVVIYRGPDDMEDVPTTTNVVMPSVAETPETPDMSVDDGSRDASRIYVPEPYSPHDMPLLMNDDSGLALGSTRSNLAPPVGITPLRQSVDTLDSSGESEAALLQGRSPDPNVTPDPRGDAPPYFEVVGMDDMNISPADSPQLSLDAPPTPEPAPAQPQRNETSRRSRFLGIFRPGRPAPNAAADAAPGHTRDDSGPSVASMTSSRGPRLHSRATHRPSFSAGSGSMFSAMSRTRSHGLDQAQLTSPSMISLNSISAPLSHTLMRTEFTYPRSGPTPEQIALISSRESFARFGVPYGEDAIAFATSSRLDLSPNIPPPDFEEATALSRAESRATDDVLLEEPTPRGPVTSLPADSGSADISPSSSPANDTITQDVPSQDTEPAVSSADAVQAASDAPASSPAAPSAASAAAQTASPSTASTDISRPPGLHERTPSPTATKARSPLSQPSARAPSRASSLTSFATAEESVHSDSPKADSPAASAPLAFAAVSPSVAAPLTAPAPADDTADGGRTPHAQSEPPTPRVIVRTIEEVSEEPPRATPTADTPATPVSSVSEVGRAL